MARHKTKTDGALALTWARLSSTGIWSIGLLWFAAIVTGAATYLMDYLRTENGSLLWLGTYLISLSLSVLLAFAAKKWILPKMSESRVGLANVGLGALVGGIKNVSVALLSLAFNLETKVDFLFRFLGGLTMGLGIITVYAGITGSRVAHSQALQKLNSIRNDLLGSKENLDVLLADELERLIERSRETVLPKIAQISLLLKSKTETSELVLEINETVATKLRPLMDEIAISSSSGLDLPAEAIPPKYKVQTPRNFVAREVIKPVTFFFYALPAISFLTFYFQGLAGAGVGAISTLLFAATMWLFKVALMPKRATSRVASYAMITLASVVAPVAGLYVIGGALPLDAHQSVLVPFICWLIYIFTVTVVSPVILLDSESKKLEKIIEAENTQLAKEIAVFEQKLWVFKKRWLFMLHGTVQSALTAALTRLQTFAESDPYQVSLVQADLERAEKALQSVPANEIDFEKAAAELTDSWAGVCAITIRVDMRASRALVTNQGTAYCVNEILKEAIGNAVRHGGATAALVNITRLEDDFIDIEVQNDGSAPGKRRKKGIGSRMLDDITFRWSLERSGRLTTLKARLPL